jgi:hypothetical protein
VHEQIEIIGKIGYLTQPLHHFSYATLREYWKKADTYTTLTAQEFLQNRIRKGIKSWGYYFIVKPIIVFISLHIRHKGFMDSWQGLLFALFSALHFPIAYLKFLRL